MLSFTFASAVSSLADYQYVPLPGYSPSIRDGTQAMRMFVEMKGASSGDVVTVNMVLVLAGDVIGVFPATCTATTTAGAYGQVATVSFAEGSTSVLDMLGASTIKSDNMASEGVQSGKSVWKVGVLAFPSGTTGVRVYAEHSQEI